MDAAAEMEMQRPAFMGVLNRSPRRAVGMLVPVR